MWLYQYCPASVNTRDILGGLPFPSPDILGTSSNFSRMEVYQARVAEGVVCLWFGLDIFTLINSNLLF